MFFKKTPEAPSISNEQEYIEWFAEHSKTVAHLRIFFLHDMSTFVSATTLGAMEILRDYPDGDSLFERIGDLSVAYEKKMKPLIERRGGLARCPHVLRCSAIGLMTNIAVGIEFLEKKYKHPVALDLFAAIDQ